MKRTSNHSEQRLFHEEVLSFIQEKRKRFSFLFEQPMAAWGLVCKNHKRKFLHTANLCLHKVLKHLKVCRYWKGLVIKMESTSLLIQEKAGKKMKKRNIILLTVVVLAAIFVVVIPKILFPKHEEPKVTGNHEVCVIMDTWVDEARKETYSEKDENRSVTVKFWYPREEGKYPLVVFSHGATGVIDSNTSTCKELASNGYVVVSVAHPYQAFYVEDVNGKKTFIDRDFMNQVMTDNGSDEPEHEREVYENSRKWMEIRTGDMNFVLDTIIEKCKVQEADVYNRINLDRIGLFGHSLGGATAVSVGRQRNDIDAVIDLEGTMLGEYTGYENDEYLINDQPYTTPLLDVNSSAVYEEAKKYADREYVNFYVGRNAKDFHEVVFHNVSHLNFTDLPLVSPILAKMLGTDSSHTDAKVCIETVNDMVLHYFDYYLKGASELLIEEEYDIPSK